MVLALLAGIVRPGIVGCAPGDFAAASPGLSVVPSGEAELLAELPFSLSLLLPFLLPSASDPAITLSIIIRMRSKCIFQVQDSVLTLNF
jgi:hypothetical protein